MANYSSQDILEVDHIKEGIIILKSKGMRMVLMVSSLNFALKSSEEQDATIFQFQNFLNSLDFSCQILVQSRRLNFIGYLDKLKEVEMKEKNDLLKLQVSEYRNFIAETIKGSVIMQKSFYVVIPFSPSETHGLTPKATAPRLPLLTEEVFQRCRNQLLQRAEFVILGLRSCGLFAVPLNTFEIIELLWGLYHPVESEHGYYPEIPPELMT